MRPIAHADGHDGPRLIDELIPGFAAERDDVVLGSEDPVRQPVVAHELPDVLDGVQLGRSWRQRQQGDVVGDGQHGGHMPSGLIDNHHAVGTGIDGCADLGEMRLHGVSVTPRHNQTGALALGGADGAEYVGPFGALVVGCAGSGLGSC